MCASQAERGKAALAVLTTAGTNDESAGAMLAGDEELRGVPRIALARIES
jgi:hypothetical protein